MNRKLYMKTKFCASDISHWRLFNIAGSLVMTDARGNLRLGWGVRTDDRARRI
jgi:hypothetical protein